MPETQTQSTDSNQYDPVDFGEIIPRGHPVRSRPETVPEDYSDRVRSALSALWSLIGVPEFGSGRERLAELGLETSEAFRDIVFGINTHISNLDSRIFENECEELCNKYMRIHNRNNEPYIVSIEPRGRGSRGMNIYQSIKNLDLSGGVIKTDTVYRFSQFVNLIELDSKLKLMLESMMIGIKSNRERSRYVVTLMRAAGYGTRTRII